MFARAMLLFGLVTLVGHAVDAGEKAKTPRQALQVFNEQIGSWRGTGTPFGTLEEKQKGFWTETVRWEWQFKGDDAWIKITITDGKHFTGGSLRYVPAKDHYQLEMRTVDKKTKTFTGKMHKHVLTVACVDGGQTDRLVFTLLHADRFLYRQEQSKAEGAPFRKLYQVGATKEGIVFAPGDGKPECIVSGGLGTMPVMHNGKTYYVCCSGCLDEFRSDPEKYIREFEARKKNKKKGN